MSSVGSSVSAGDPDAHGPEAPCYRAPMPSDAASAVSPDDKKRYFACQCVDGLVDVDSKSADGRTYTLSVGEVPVAELVVNNVATFSITRSWTAQGTTNVVQVVAAFDGS